LDEKRSLKPWGYTEQKSGLQGRLRAVHSNSINPTVNSILLNWRDLWPGGLDERAYSTLNLLALCRQGPLGFNHVRCEDCRHAEWFASSCGTVQPPRGCAKCGSERCRILRLLCRPGETRAATAMALQLVASQGRGRYSLVPPDSG